MRSSGVSRGGPPFVVVAGVFFLSGISGLMYQVLWLRLLSVVFGVTAYAASTILASFMCGLAIGSVVAGRLANRALVELGIGISALLTPWLLQAAQSVTSCGAANSAHVLACSAASTPAARSRARFSRDSI